MPGIKNMLIIGTFTGGSIERFYKHGFEKCGVTVDTYGTVDEFYGLLGKSIINKMLNKISSASLYNGINTRLLKFMKGRRYEVILVFKGMELYRDTLAELKEYTSLLINYNCDHPFLFFSPGSGNKNVRDSIPEYDIHFSYSRSIVAKLQKEFDRQAYFIPFGYNNQVSLKQNANNTEYAGRILFIGLYDAQRAAFLDSLHIPNLDIYGDSKWKTRNLMRPQIEKAYKQRPLFDEDYLAAVNYSMGIVNILREQNLIEHSHNMRTFEAPGYGGLLISQRTTEQLEFFEDNREALFFDSTDELNDKINFLRNNPLAVQSIKKAGYERSQKSGYDYDERSRALLECLIPYLS